MGRILGHPNDVYDARLSTVGSTLRTEGMEPPEAHRRPKIRLSWCAVPMHHDDPPVSSGVTMTMIDR
jgi:hypothetical protein